MVTQSSLGQGEVRTPSVLVMQSRLGQGQGEVKQGEVNKAHAWAGAACERPLPLPLPCKSCTALRAVTPACLSALCIALRTSGALITSPWTQMLSASTLISLPLELLTLPSVTNFITRPTISSTFSSP